MQSSGNHTVFNVSNEVFSKTHQDVGDISHKDEHPQFCLQKNTLPSQPAKLSAPLFSIFYDMNMQLPWLLLPLIHGENGIVCYFGVGGWVVVAVERGSW